MVKIRVVVYDQVVRRVESKTIREQSIRVQQNP